MFGSKVEPSEMPEARETLSLKATRPALRFFCVLQSVTAFCFFGLAILGIMIEAAYASVAMGIWAGFLGCSLAAVCIGHSIRPTRHFYLVVVSTVVLAAHMAFFIFSFFAASVDFSKLLTSLKAISSVPIACSFLTMVSPSVLSGRLIVDVLEFCFVILAIYCDVIAINYSYRKSGSHGPIYYNEESSEQQNSANRTASQNVAVYTEQESRSTTMANNTESIGGDPVKTARARIEGKLRIGALMWKDLWLQLVLPIFCVLSSLAFSITCVVLSTPIRMIPAVWNIALSILFSLGRRDYRKNGRKSHIYLIAAFSVSCAGGILLFVMSIANIVAELGSIKEIYGISDALEICSGDIAAPTASTDAVPSVNYTFTWRLTIEIVCTMVNAYLMCIMGFNIALIYYLSKFVYEIRDLELEQELSLKQQQIQSKAIQVIP